MIKEELAKALIKAYGYGIDYGLLKAEEERDIEDLFNAGLGVAYDDKMSMPLNATQRRQPHSDEWRQPKKKAECNLWNLIAEVIQL